MTVIYIYGADWIAALAYPANLLALTGPSEPAWMESNSLTRQPRLSLFSLFLRLRASETVADKLLANFLVRQRRP